VTVEAVAETMTGPDAPWLRLRGVSCALGGVRVVEDLSLDLRRGELGALLGPSGSGKSTLLRAIAGLVPVAAGRIELRGAVVSAPGMVVAPERRRVGLVFQDLALFPHLDVVGNIGFGLGFRARPERSARIRELIAVFELEGLERRRPHELSGGQQQRVAIARALAPAPDLLLLDEPFSSLDADLRARLRHEIRLVLRRLGVTALLVTHDHAESLAFADRVGVIGEGRLHQWDTPARVYRDPADAFVAGFVGEGVLLDGTASREGTILTALGSLEAAPPAPAPGSRRRVLVRPQQVLRADRGHGADAEVRAADFTGADVLLELQLGDGSRLAARWAEVDPPRVGDVVRIVAKAVAYPHFAVDSGLHGDRSPNRPTA
jgi:iron(III) transport system ATP-binding protein